MGWSAADDTRCFLLVAERDGASPVSTGSFVVGKFKVVGRLREGDG